MERPRGITKAIDRPRCVTDGAVTDSLVKTGTVMARDSPPLRVRTGAVMGKDSAGLFPPKMQRARTRKPLLMSVSLSRLIAVEARTTGA